MSGRAEKTTRRDLRRAFGQNALDTIDRQGLALEGVMRLQHTHVAQFADLTALIAAQELALRQEAYARWNLLNRSLWQRVRWILVGR